MFHPDAYPGGFLDVDNERDAILQGGKRRIESMKNRERRREMRNLLDHINFVQAEACKFLNEEIQAGRRNHRGAKFDF